MLHILQLFSRPKRLIGFSSAGWLFILTLIAGCTSLQTQPSTAPTLDVVKPAIIQPNDLPLEFRVTGSGFNTGSRIQLSLPDNASQVINIQPKSVRKDSLVFVLDEKTFAELASRIGQLQAARLPLESIRENDSGYSEQRYFHVAVVNGKDVSSRRFPLAITQAKTRIISVGSGSASVHKPITAMVGSRIRIPLTIATHENEKSINVSAQVFQVLKDGTRQPVSKTGGVTKVPPYTTDTTIEIATPEVELGNDYEISFSIDGCVNCFDYTVPVDVIENPEITCPTCGPLFAPTGLEIIAVDTQAGTVSLRWADNSNRESSHRIIGLGGAIATAPANEGTGIVEWTGPMPPGTNPLSACYQVSSFNQYGELASNRDCGFPDQPNAPDRLRVTDRERHSLSLAWVDNSTTEEIANPNPPPYSGFELRRAFCLDCPYRTFGSLGGHPGTGPMDFTDGDLVADKQYCYKVGATNARGTRWSSGVCATTLYEPPPPDAPGQFSIYDKTENSIELRWRDYAHNEDGFKVQRRYPDGDRTNHANLPVHEGTGWMNWTDQNLRPGTTYCYRIKEYNEYGANFTNEKCGTTLAGAPGAPDLAVDFVRIVEPTEPNKKFHLMYGVCNMGGPIDGSFTDKVVKDGNYGAAKSSSHGPLGAFECYQQSVEYSGVPEGCYIWEVHVDAPIESNGQVEESAEANNLGGLRACFW